VIYLLTDCSSKWSW